LQIEDIANVINFSRILEHGWIRTAHWYPVIDSTNSHLRRELASWDSNSVNSAAITQSSRLELPWLIVADQQTSGRGRGDHTWWSPEGCLMSSIAIHAQTEHAQWLPYLVAIAIARTIDSTLGSAVGSVGRCKIKWPNDIFVDDKKIAGVLIEQITSQARPTWIIGSGINVDVDFASAPASVQSRAISLNSLLEAGLSMPITWQASTRDERMTDTLATFILNLYDQLLLADDDPNAWYAEWTNRCYLRGKPIEATVSCWEANISENPPLGLNVGICLGLDVEGQLLIQHESGSIGRIVTGSVRIV
jgi:BirA family transcriptional regulator, biotin operon repressor / biotin---[acetyl-CoA-carboxylase] ligase